MTWWTLTCRLLRFTTICKHWREKEQRLPLMLRFTNVCRIISRVRLTTPKTSQLLARWVSMTPCSTNWWEISSPCRRQRLRSCLPKLSNTLRLWNSTNKLSPQRRLCWRPSTTWWLTPRWVLMKSTSVLQKLFPKPRCFLRSNSNWSITNVISISTMRPTSTWCSVVLKPKSWRLLIRPTMKSLTWPELRERFVFLRVPPWIISLHSFLACWFLPCICSSRTSSMCPSPTVRMWRNLPNSRSLVRWLKPIRKTRLWLSIHPSHL